MNFLKGLNKIFSKCFYLNPEKKKTVRFQTLINYTRETYFVVSLVHLLCSDEYEIYSLTNRSQVLYHWAHPSY